MLDGHLLPCFGDRALAELEAQPELIDAYIALKAKSGLSTKTIQNQLLLLNVMLRRAVVWRLMRANPVSSIDRPSLVQPEMSVLTETEIARLANAYDELIARARFCGPRSHPSREVGRTRASSARHARARFAVSPPFVLFGQRPLFRGLRQRRVRGREKIRDVSPVGLDRGWTELSEERVGRAGGERADVESS